MRGKRFIAEYDIRKLNQIHYRLRLSRSRAIWDKSHELSESAKQFLFDVTKECSNCSWCSKGKFKTIGPFEVNYRGVYYAEKVEDIKSLLNLQEKVI